MADAVLVFTFSPVQGFIAEARRTADLFAGSRILVDLARAAAEQIMREVGPGALVFPAALTSDVPNRLVARVPADRAEELARAAESALQQRWHEITGKAQSRLRGLQPPPDPDWQTIWDRQVSNFWEVFWAVAPYSNGGYADAYIAASRALDAAKRTRAFTQVAEPGRKDSLSGRREALHIAEGGADAATLYWRQVAANPAVSAARLQPDGRERLDAIGAVKRFGEAGMLGFASTSAVAARSFLRQAAERAPGQLADYQSAVERLVSGRLPRVGDDPTWPYDGDLLYRETLEPARLKSSYGLDAPDEGARKHAICHLKALHRQVGGGPSTYYAVVALDGDGMGEAISRMLQAGDAETAHRALSGRLTRFADAVLKLERRHHAEVVYNGGDDVLALVPLDEALSFTQALARTFSEHVSVDGHPATASAGIAIAHHTSPLGTAVRAARAAEAQAKQVPGKNAVCVMALKRSGETVQVRAPWETLTDTDGDPFADLVAALGGEDRDGPLATRVVSTLAASARAFADVEGPFRSELRRLLGRHTWTEPDAEEAAARPRGLSGGSAKPAQWEERLVRWARLLPEETAGSALDRRPRSRPEHLADWVGLAAFVARGGGE